MPTPAGLELFELLRGAVPALVDPSTTAVWEMRLDDVTVGKADFRAIIDEIAGDRLIRVLQQHSGGIVDLGQPVRTKGGRSRIRRRSRGRGHAAANPDESKPKSCRPRKAKNAAPGGWAQTVSSSRVQAAGIRPADTMPTPTLPKNLRSLGWWRSPRTSGRRSSAG